MARRGEGRTITADGRTLTVLQWAAWRGWDPATIRNRLRLGWEPVRAVTEQPRDVDRTGERDRNEVRRERRRLRAEAGLCIHCGVAAESGKTQCARHLAAAAESMRDLQQTRRELGMCVRCDEPAQPGFSTCAAHGEYNAELLAEERAHKVAIGECTACKRRAAKGHVLCRIHLAEDRWSDVDRAARHARQDEHRAEGTCTKCGAPRAKRSTLCPDHKAQLAAVVAATRAAKRKAAERAKIEVRPGVIRRKPRGNG